MHGRAAGRAGSGIGLEHGVNTRELGGPVAMLSVVVVFWVIVLCLGDTVDVVHLGKT